MSAFKNPNLAQSKSPLKIRGETISKSGDLAHLELTSSWVAYAVFCGDRRDPMGNTWSTPVQMLADHRARPEHSGKKRRCWRHPTT